LVLGMEATLTSKRELSTGRRIASKCRQWWNSRPGSEWGGCEWV